MKCAISCVQTKPLLTDKPVNVERMCAFIDQTMFLYPRTQLIVFPELATTGYECGEAFQTLAEIPADPNAFSIRRLSGKAAEYGVHIIYGFPERKKAGDPDIYNSQILIDDHGTCVGTYQKVQLFDGEKQWFKAGDTFKVFDTVLGKMGLFICYDAFFPEAARVLSLKGADLLVNSTNWEKPYAYDMDTLMTARALENTVYLVCCNRIGFDKTLGFFGHSRILDPLGHPIVSLDNEVEGIIHTVVDYEIPKKMKADYYTMLSERRTEAYGELLKPE